MYQSKAFIIGILCCLIAALIIMCSILFSKPTTAGKVTFAKSDMQTYAHVVTLIAKSKDGIVPEANEENIMTQVIALDLEKKLETAGQLRSFKNALSRGIRFKVPAKISGKKLRSLASTDLLVVVDENLKSDLVGVAVDGSPVWKRGQPGINEPP